MIQDLTDEEFQTFWDKMFQFLNDEDQKQLDLTDKELRLMSCITLLYNKAPTNIVLKEYYSIIGEVIHKMETNIDMFLKEYLQEK